MLAPWLRRFFSEYISTERNLALNTQNSYRDTFELLLPFISRTIRKSDDRLALQDVNAVRVREFLHYLETERDCSIATRNLRLTAIRSFARYVASQEPACKDWAQSVRAIETKKSSPQPIGWLTVAETEDLLKVPDIRRIRGRMEHALLLFLYNTGARVSEAVNLQVCDLQLAARDGRHALVTLHGKGGKVRRCPLQPHTASVLMELIRHKGPDEAVFISQTGNPYTRFGVYRLVTRCADQVPALKGRKISPHWIRHSTACHLLQAGIDLNTIYAWLGHVSLDTTNVYAEIDLRMNTGAMELSEFAQPHSSSPGRKQNTGIMAFLKSL